MVFEEGWASFELRKSPLCKAFGSSFPNLPLGWKF